MSEVLASAFRTHSRGPLVGETTAGKGVGQTAYPVHDEGLLHLVRRTYYYPGTRDTWNESGIPPDTEIVLDDEARETLAPYLEASSPILSEQWSKDEALRRADQLLREKP